MRRFLLAATMIAAAVVPAAPARADVAFVPPYADVQADTREYPGTVLGTAAADASADGDTGLLSVFSEVSGDSPKFGTGAVGIWVASPYADAVSQIRLHTPVARGRYEVTVSYRDVQASAEATRDGLRIKGTSNDDPFGLCIITDPCLNHRALTVSQLRLDLNARPCSPPTTCEPDITTFTAAPIGGCGITEDDPARACRKASDIRQGTLQTRVDVLRTSILEAHIILFSFADVWGNASAASRAALVVDGATVRRVG